MNEKMTEKYIYRTECCKCKKIIEREAREDFRAGLILNADYEIHLNILVNETPNEEYGRYHKRLAQFCSPKCLVAYCNDMKIEDLDLPKGETDEKNTN